MTESSPCPACGTPNDLTANFCENCGSDLRASRGGLDDMTAANDETVSVKQDKLKTALASSAAEHAVAFKTDIGYSHHVNQDAGGVRTVKRPDGTSVALLTVADGVSAGRHSEAASRLTVEVIEGHMAPLLFDPSLGLDGLLRELVIAAREANHRVAERPHHSLSSADATTLVSALCLGSRGAGVWCGDSRVYLVGNRTVTRMTRDHSWAEGVVGHGLMSAEDAARDPRARMITRWLGPPDQDDPGLEVFHFRLTAGDILLCCTDGLYMYFSPPAGSEEEIRHVLSAHRGDLQAGVDELVEIALQRGGRDNITAAVIEVSGDDLDDEPEIPAQVKAAAVDRTIRLNQPLAAPRDD